MAILTISRESGSAGSGAGQRVAETLGYHFMDKEGIGEVMRRVGLVEFDREYDSALNFWDQFDVRRMGRREEMIDTLNQVLLALARHGNTVIVGRCGYVVLQEYADVLDVRFQAPFPLRVERMMARHKMDDLFVAEEFVRRQDRVRADFVESFYGEQWIETRFFDLVIDTAMIPIEMAAGWIAEALPEVDRRLEPGMKTTADIVVDATVRAAVCAVLGCEQDHRT